MEIGASDQQQLILSECNTSSITASGVWFNSTMGRVSLGDSVPHNTQLDIHCNPYCRMLVGDNNTLCINGTFEPAGNARCDCSPGNFILCMCTVDSIYLLFLLQIRQILIGCYLFTSLPPFRCIFASVV